MPKVVPGGRAWRRKEETLVELVERFLKSCVNATPIVGGVVPVTGSRASGDARVVGEVELLLDLADAVHGQGRGRSADCCRR